MFKHHRSSDGGSSAKRVIFFFFFFFHGGGWGCGGGGVGVRRPRVGREGCYKAIVSIVYDGLKFYVSTAGFAT
jgi:hypothetical protein